MLPEAVRRVAVASERQHLSKAAETCPDPYAWLLNLLGIRPRCCQRAVGEAGQHEQTRAEGAFALNALTRCSKLEASSSRASHGMAERNCEDVTKAIQLGLSLVLL